MPFTGSHPAAVLPLLRTPLPASALVIGSIAPDVPYFLFGRPAWTTHTALAVVTADLLIGVVVWLLWHGVLAGPALAAAPAALRARLVGRVRAGVRARLGSVRLAVLTVLALVVGAGTHVLWDEFTHAEGWGPAHLGVLRLSAGGLPGYGWAQYGSGVLGALAIACWTRGWWRRTPARPVAASGPVARWVWPGLVALAVVVGVLAAIGRPDLGSAGFAGATRGGSAAGAAALLLAAGWHVRRLRRPRADVRRVGAPG
ncbi:DUF4184 family protein [Pseudonocardia humida]|uniref:DUF4184 family protein n=1 Tax=Pseudonocardia humida TaxID=2800819 RepID=A0ABT1A8A3_9PSEU|nr:DUF4184 family protein [Pseudonocardia humida]MCO1659259.1 DUF4184 family protein [Pseudonocardia humida]